MNIYDLPQKWLHIFEAFHLASIQIITFDHFLIIRLILRSVLEIFDISKLRISLWLFEHHTFQYVLVSLFPSQILVCATAFAAHYLFSRYDNCWAIKAVVHTSIRLGKRETDLYENVWCPKSQRLVHQVEISKISGIDLKMRCIDSKWSNVMNCKEAKWKASSYVIIFYGRSYMFHFYNWNRSLNIVLVVYDLIELIIETSL